MDWKPFLWLAASMLLLWLANRWINRHLQGVALLVANDSDIATVLYALPLLPGVVLHELSHALMAVLLGVGVGRISIWPRRQRGRIRLGTVPVEETDALRASLIGLAPLLSGLTVILLVGHLVFGIDALGAALLAGDLRRASLSLTDALQAGDAWLWGYVIFAVSNTMMPSSSDRRGWLPVSFALLALGGLAWAVGLGPLLLEQLARPLGDALRWLAVVFTFTVLVDVPFLLAIALAERLLERVKGVRVEY